MKNAFLFRVKARKSCPVSKLKLQQAQSVCCYFAIKINLNWTNHCPSIAFLTESQRQITPKMVKGHVPAPRIRRNKLTQ